MVVRLSRSPSLGRSGGGPQSRAGGRGGAALARAAARPGRRAVLAGKAALAAAELGAVPLGTELLARPGPGAGGRARGGGRGAAEVARSLLPEAPPAGALAEAKASLAAGDAALEAGCAAEAEGYFTRAGDSVGRAQYRLWQAARLRRAKARSAQGDREGAGADQRAVWWWGRGVRWPGHYIIAYLSARAAWSDARELRRTRGERVSDGGALSRCASDGSLGPAELAAVLAGGTLFLQVLGRYGLPDF